MKYLFKIFLLESYLILLIFSFSQVVDSKEADAQTMTNSNYILQMGNLNSFSGRGTGSGNTLTFTGGQSGANLFSGPNFKVKLGFQYIYPFAFRFSISSIFIDFGIISPTIPVTRSNQLTVTNHSAYGYQVTVSQDHNLRVDSTGNEIPATTCDGGSCTPTTAAAWTSSLVYGFGYRCDNVSGTDCDAQFSTGTFYKPFVASPSAVVVMSSTTVGTNRKTNVTYKVNVSGSQAPGLYKNILNYIATPTF
jgi:hypothetical protein